MKNFQFINTKVIATVFAPLNVLAVESLAQTSGVTMQMELLSDVTSQPNFQAMISFEMQGNKMPTTVKNLKIEGGNVTFATDFQNSEIRFDGNLTGNKLSVKLEVFEKGNRVATGTWSLTQTDDGHPANMR